jgi:hypothetical protein
MEKDMRGIRVQKSGARISFGRGLQKSSLGWVAEDSGIEAKKGALRIIFDWSIFTASEHNRCNAWGLGALQNRGQSHAKIPTTQC